MANPMMTTDDPLFQTQYYNDTLLPIMKRDAMLTKLIPVDKFAERSGTDVIFFGRNPIDVVSGTKLAGTEITDPTAVHLTGRKITEPLYRLHNSVGYSNTEKQTSFDGIMELRDIIGVNIVESLEIWNWRRIAPGLVHVRADWDTSSPYQLKYSATSAGSTSTVVSTTLSQADDYWGGNSTQGYIMPITKNNENYGQGRKVDDFATSGDTLTIDVSGNSYLSAWTTATASGDQFINCIGTGLTTGDKMTLATIGKVNALFGQGELDIGNEFKFANPGGMGHKLLISTLEHYDIESDTSLQNYRINNSKSPGFEKWSLGSVYQNEMLMTGLGYRESAAGAYSATGAVYNAMFMGKKTAQRTELVKPKIIPVTGADSNNLAGYQNWLTWTTDYAAGTNVGTSGCVVLNVPTVLI